MQYCPTYYDAIAMQKRLMGLTLEGAEPKDAAACARAWLELEWFKREARGKPRLKPIDATALLRDARAKLAPRATPLELESELVIDEGKESLNSSEGQGTATPDAPNAIGLTHDTPPPSC